MYWSALSGQIVAHKDFSFRIPPFSMRQGLAMMIGLDQHAFSELALPELAVEFLSHWELVSELLCTLHEFYARERFNLASPTVWHDEPLVLVESEEWINRKHRIVAFNRKLAQYTEVVSLPTSLGELYEAIKLYSTKTELNDLLPRAYPIGQALPVKVIHLFDIDYYQSSCIRDITMGLPSLLNKQIIERAFPNFWKRFSKKLSYNISTKLTMSPGIEQKLAYETARDTNRSSHRELDFDGSNLSKSDSGYENSIATED